MALAGVEGGRLGEREGPRGEGEVSAGRARAGAGWGARLGDAGALPGTAAEGKRGVSAG